MAGSLDSHLGKETAERYAMGSVSGRAAARIEEHLLACEPCRQSVAAADTYVSAMRAAAAKLRRGGRKPKSRAARKAGG